MKGTKYRDRKHKLQFPVYVEAKIDEIRCHVKRKTFHLFGAPDVDTVEFLSYAEKPLHNLDSFAEQFLALMDAHNLDELDTGVLVNGNFNDSYRWTRSSKNKPKDLNEDMVQFTLYDLPGDPRAYSYRRDSCRIITAGWPGIKWHVIPSVLADSHDGINECYLLFRDWGHEGAMVKEATSLYERDKCDRWQKLKPEEDADGIIIGFTEAVSEAGVPLGRVGSVKVRVEDGSIAQPSGIAHELGREMFEHPERFLNLWCEFKYMERDRDGGYRHPIFHRIREAKA